MSGKLMGMVWDLELGHAESKVLLVLCDHADDVPGEPGLGVNCFPSIRRIVWKTGYRRRPVQRILRRLECAGIIVEVKRGSGPHKSEYEVRLENAKKKRPLERRPPGRLSGATPSPPLGATLGSPLRGDPRSAATPRSPVTPQSPEGRPSRPPQSPLVPTQDPPPLANTLFSPAPESPNNNVFETYISEVGKIFAHLPGAIPSQNDRQIVERWFASKVAIPTVKLGLLEGMLRHISGPNYDRTVNLAYFVPIIDEFLKNSRAVPPHIVDFSYTQLADHLKERSKFPRASWMELPKLQEVLS